MRIWTTQMRFLGAILSILAATQGKDDPDRLKVLLHMGLGTLSHIKPLFEIGMVLRERNHSVVYAAFEDTEVYSKPYQFPFISLGASPYDKAEQRKLMKGMGATYSASRMIQAFGIISPLAYDIIYPALEKVIEQETPDVVVCDFFATACRDLAEMKGIPLVTGFQSTDAFGIASSSFITDSTYYGPITTNQLNFLERFRDKIVAPALSFHRFYPLVTNINRIRKKYNVPPTSFPFGDFSTSLGLANTFFGLEAASNIPPNIKLVGPIQSRPSSLPPRLVQFLDIHQRTLYIAFGSAAVLDDFDIENLVLASIKALEDGSIDGVLWALGKTLPEDFPEHFGGTNITRDYLLSNQHPHFQLLDWVPQTAILDHKSTRLFVSHGGLESSFDAILSGTPVLCMPFFGDQPRNARKLEDAGIGKYINRNTVTPSSLKSHIQEMLEDVDGSIAANAQRMQIIAQMGSRRKEAGADAIEEYVYTAQACRPLYKHKYGEIPCELQHLSLASRNMSFIKSNLIDVYTVALLVPILLLSSLAYTLHRLLRRWYRIHPKGSTKTKED